MEKKGTKRTAEQSQQDAKTGGLSKKIKWTPEDGSTGEKVKWNPEDDLDFSGDSAPTAPPAGKPQENKAEETEESTKCLGCGGYYLAVKGKWVRQGEYRFRKVISPKPCAKCGTSPLCKKCQGVPCGLCQSREEPKEEMKKCLACGNRFMPIRTQSDIIGNCKFSRVVDPRPCPKCGVSPLCFNCQGMRLCCMCEMEEEEKAEKEKRPAYLACAKHFEAIKEESEKRHDYDPGRCPKCESSPVCTNCRGRPRCCICDLQEEDEQKKEEQEKEPTMYSHPNQEHYADAMEGYENRKKHAEAEKEDMMHCADCDKPLGITLKAWIDLDEEEKKKFGVDCANDDCGQVLCPVCVEEEEHKMCKSCIKAFKTDGGACADCGQFAVPEEACPRCKGPWCEHCQDGLEIRVCINCRVICPECTNGFDEITHPGGCPGCDETHDHPDTCKGCAHDSRSCEKDCMFCEKK